MIAYKGHTGEHLSALDRAVLLRRLVALTDQHDALIAAGLLRSREAEQVRCAALDVLKRLGVPAETMRQITGRTGPLPQPTDEAMADAVPSEEDWQ